MNDTSTEYIEMCTKAKEIQKEGGYSYGGAEKKSTWLPSQDQLQKMLFGSVWGKARRFAQFIWGDPLGEEVSEYAEQFTTMEQLWLAFVMRVKYQKRWNGEEWIGESTNA